MKKLENNAFLNVLCVLQSKKGVQYWWIPCRYCLYIILGKTASQPIKWTNDQTQNWCKTLWKRVINANCLIRLKNRFSSEALRHSIVVSTVTNPLYYAIYIYTYMKYSLITDTNRKYFFSNKQNNTLKITYVHPHNYE